MTTTETFLIAMAIIFTVPYLVWRLGRTEYFAPLAVVQILAGIVLGPGVLGAWFPDYHAFVFNPQVVQALHGIAWWAVMLFVFLAGLELDLHAAWRNRRETGITAGLALGVPLALGVAAALLLLAWGPEWMGAQARPWQFVVSVGMACAVTALPVLIVFLEKLEILRAPLGQRVLRYASVDDVAVWAVLALILMDWTRIGRQAAFLVGFALVALGFRRLLRALGERDRWFAALIWLCACSFAADWAGLHYMVGAFLAGAVVDGQWFDRTRRDQLRHHVLLVLMPVFFLSTGLRTDWGLGGAPVLLAGLLLLLVSVAGKLLGVQLAGRLLGWPRGEAPLIGWLLQAKGLIMIVFANVALDMQLISGATFTALLLMGLGSTMLTMPRVTPMLRRLQALGSGATAPRAAVPRAAEVDR